MLKINNLTKSYGNNRGIENVSLEVKRGEVFGFIGPNGAGKSTTIKCILELINKNSGEIYIDGELVTKDNYSIKNRIGFLPSSINLYEELTVKEMLSYSASFYSKNLSKRIKELVKRLDLDLNKKIGELSFGNLKKVGIVIALMHEPTLLILDEATSGLDPLMQEVFFDILKEEKEKGTTIFFSSHILSEVKNIADKVGIIKEGKLIKVDEISKIFEAESLIITIRSSNYKKMKLPVDDVIVKYQDDDMIKFLYHGDINELLKLLSSIKVDKILIEEPTLEEIFINYYK